VSVSEESTSIGEVVIIRRRGGDDLAATKGGAWKIAYADFVTAMMAFFLVMWLINASNEATRAQVASYFNPIKLTDSSTGNRGLRDRKKRKTTDSYGGESTTEGPEPSPEDVVHESEIMNDPNSTLDKILSDASVGSGKGRPVSAASDMSPPSMNPSELSAPGDGDPFSPRSWDETKQIVPPLRTQVNAESKQDRTAPNVNITSSENAGVGLNHLDRDKNGNERATPREPTDRAPQQTGTEEMAFQHDIKEETPINERESKQNVAADISAEIAARLGSGLDQLPESVEVAAVSDGVLISLTDKANFGMFKTGSAEPEPQLFNLVSAIASVLAERNGFIVVRGHTDSRPFRNKKYDNWQLSTSRAHFAQYMLIKGGLDERRIRRIEGMADRNPKIPDDPDAAANRRIEILLGTDDPSQ